MLDSIMLKVTMAYASFRDREDGQALVEYALILALISVVAVAALSAIGTNVNTVLGTIRDDLAGA